MKNKGVYTLMVLASIFWSGAFIAGKLAIQEFPPFALVFFRFLFALPFVFGILYSRQPKEWLPNRKQMLPLILLGIIGTFSYHLFFFSALKFTTAINSSLIGATNPMITTILAILFFREHISLSRALGILLSFSGVFLIVTNADLQILLNFRFNPGDILMFIAVWCWASYALLSRRFMQNYNISPLMLTAYTFFVCTIVSFPFLLWERPGTYIYETSSLGWLSILYMALFASVLGYLFQLITIQNIGAARASIFINLVPIFTIIQSIIILREPLSFLDILSAGTIIIGVYLASRPGTKNFGRA